MFVKKKKKKKVLVSKSAMELLKSLIYWCRFSVFASSMLDIKIQFCLCGHMVKNTSHQ